MVREGSAPNFCPPTEEGVTITLVDEKGEQVELEFLGLVLKGESSFGFFFPVDDEHPATSSGEVVVLEVTEVDDEGQPASFELVDDEVIAAEAYAAFQEAAKDLYDFAEGRRPKDADDPRCRSSLRAHVARAADSLLHCRRSLEQGDRRPAFPLRADGEGASVPYDGQVGPLEPGGARGLRLRDGAALPSLIGAGPLCRR